jgi:rhamnogalacturonan endolyase
MSRSSFTVGIIFAFARVACIFADAVPVTVNDDGRIYTLSNGIVTAKVSRASGNLTSLAYNGIETLDRGGGAAGGYWSHSALSDQGWEKITIDPKTNNGERGEVSVKGIANGLPMGSGPGGSVIADIEIRWCLNRGDSGIYTYCVMDHLPDYPATNLGEARFCAKLNDDVFDWMTVDANRNMKLITAYDWNHGEVMNMKEARRMTTGDYKGQVEHKYDYSANQFDVLAWGWSSTSKHVGIWFVNPTIEYLSGGPTKMELSAHRDATFNPDDKTAPAPPCLLNYWRGSHYGGSSCSVAQGERWTKVIGPFLIYCNNGATPDAAWKDALARSTVETKAWPYEWVAGVDYPLKKDRATISGELVLNDSQAPDAKMSHLLVGLACPDYPSRGGFRGQSSVDWQMDAKFYQFWVRGSDDGKFSIPNVRPGKWRLHAIANGVFGEFTGADITIEPGKDVDLGKLDWKPLRHGKPIWEVGIPNRSGEEFKHGDSYYHWGLYNEYPKEFPNDVNFVIGKSKERTDWNYCQCPREDRPNGTTWTITFDLPQALKGKAILRMGLAGISARQIRVAVNDKEAGTIGPLQDNATIRRDGIHGYWSQRDLPFEASLMHVGTNTLTLTIPPGNPMNGIIYDYLRLELDDTAK